MFQSVKGIKREDLINLVQEINEALPAKVTISTLKEVVLNSKENKDDPEFVSSILTTIIDERLKEEEKQRQDEERKRQDEKERKRQDEERKRQDEERKRQDEERKRQEEERKRQEEETKRQNEEERKRQDEERKRQDEERKRQDEEREKQRQHELELARINSRVTVPEQDETPESGSVKKKFHLPKLELRQFSGDLKDWLPFWSQFEHVHNDIEIEPENKFQYLIQATVIGSRAREVVESFPPTSANYSKAVDALKSRFGRNGLLIEFYVRELLKLVLQNAQQNYNTNLCALYDSLEAQIRALETLGVTTDKSAALLHPLVESCLPEEILRAWQRQRDPDFDYAGEPQDRLNSLLKFLKCEVESEERISLAMQGFGLNERKHNNSFRNKKFESRVNKSKTPTAASLLNNQHTRATKKPLCVFCEKSHPSAECFSAKKMSLTERQKVIRDKNCCFSCLTPGHQSRKCRFFIRCLICDKKHVPIMCEELETRKQKPVNDENSTESDINMSNVNKNPKVLLQTLQAKLVSGDNIMIVRILLDSGSQKSYILKEVAEKMKYSPIREEKVIHSLFGGVTSGEVKHNCYKIKLRSLTSSFGCNFDVLDQTNICENIQSIGKDSWIKELKNIGIELSDVGNVSKPIQILIGADIMGKLLTGRRKELDCGLVAIETKLGWTVMGKFASESPKEENIAMTVTSLFVKDADISDLWKLDLIGIKDPIEKKSRAQHDFQTRQHFQETVRFKEGRYEVSLPWADDKAPLPDNFPLAKRRLDITTTKLISSHLYEGYEKVFQEWLLEGIIETVPEDEVKSYGHYLPHRPVLKESSTTPIRPVFDASARMTNHPSLNQCLESGPNLIELIPDILLRFRERKIGVTADIRKAFLQISICQKDRDFLRFLWWKNEENKELKVLRHTKVVFGVNCSPFLLGAVIEHHINSCEYLDSNFKSKLQRSFYVDNVVTSVDSTKELEEFVSKSIKVMKEGGFDLRGWEKSEENLEACEKSETPILGMIWNRHCDTLRINMSWWNEVNLDKLTKRIILSIVHKVYDPIGYSSPVMICPKLILQEAWKMRIGWDTEISGNLRHQFLKWFEELKALEEVHIPRWIHVDFTDMSTCTLHCFCDASKDAYATVVFLRVENGDNVELRLLGSKCRIAPLKGGGGTIPRKELLAALVGARLTNSIIEALNWKEIVCYYWSDSTTVIAWIQRQENWSVFVRNRVQEIRKLSNPSSWHHIFSEMNPSDLPSRGCTAKQLLSLAWWEGPQWLKAPSGMDLSFSTPEFKEEEIEQEKLKTVKTLADIGKTAYNDWYYKYFSKYQNIVRMIGWILRFKNNCSNPEVAIRGELTAKEFKEAEIRIVWMIQKESCLTENDDRLRSLGTFKDGRDILRLKTRIVYRKDHEDFIKPVILPSKHPVVDKLIYHIHERNCHAGVQITLNQLREKYWVLSGRKTVRNVLSKCVICKRFSSRNIEAVPGPLPENRVRDAAAYQIVGIDMTGPVFLKDEKKSWVLIFTCAIYRAVHLELISSASTDAFLMAFRRFVARRGRSSIIYCDNGTNFVGAANSLKQLDWSRIVKYGAVNSIQFKFNPPTAAWWGGWWERLIRLLKDLLKRVVGKACLSYEEMVTVLADCEGVMNSRPLTYIYENECLKPISPSMFIQDIYECSLPDVDTVEQKSLIRRVRYRQTLQSELRKRFRSEYLGLLVQRKNSKQEQWSISVGDIVLVGADNRKRVDWPLGRIIELLPGKDGNVRLVKIQTANNQLLRPVQRIYPLEIISSKDYPHPPVPYSHSDNTNQAFSDKVLKDDSEQETNKLVFQRKTRSRRSIQAPEKLNL